LKSRRNKRSKEEVYMPDEKILAEIKRKASFYESRQLTLLESLCAVDSGTGNVEGNKKILEIVEKELSSFGASVERVEIPGLGAHLVSRVRTGRARRKIILSAHLDTVFGPGEAARHPFHIEGEWAYGLGIADCKGGVLVSMFAVRIAQELDVIPKDSEIVMIYTCDEETGSLSGRSLFERERRGADCAFVFEPAREKNGIITSRRGCARGTVKVTGKTAHAGLAYTQGADANLELARKVTSLCGKNLPERDIFYSAGVMHGGEHVDKVSDSAFAEFFVSFASEEDLRIIAQSVKSLESERSIPGCSVGVHVEVLFPPMEKSESTLTLYNKVQEAGRFLGMTLPEESSRGSSDACWYASLGLPVVDALGPYMNAIHTTEEALRIETLKERTTLFALLLTML
jgi:glutamate carboxypeptidase